MEQISTRQIWLTVLVAALGYFVDIFDLLLFSIVRVKSLRDFGLDELQLKTVGEALLSDQMWGMLVGGVLWGILGDKRGRMSVLFGSIILYSLANIGNGLVQTVGQYQAMRFLAGLGLAGELGAGITLVAEVMRREQRGYGTTIVATVGILGAVLAYFVSTHFHWRTAYFIGGGMGLALLLLRIGVVESGFFKQMHATEVSRGNFLRIISEWKLFKRFVLCILIGLPTWFVVGILVSFSKEFSTKFGLTETADVGKAVMWCYLGLTLGDLSCGLLSQWLKSRKKALAVFHALSIGAIALYLSTEGGSLSSLYLKIAFLGYSVGYWAVFVTTAAEQFGTNLRATVATSVPNFARGLLPIIIMTYRAIEQATNGNTIQAAWAVTIITGLIAWTALYFIPESFSKDLDYYE